VALPLIDSFIVDSNTVRIKFGRTLQIATIINDNFKVFLNNATPLEVVNPFRSISLISDYNQVSKVLTLFWQKVLTPESEYVIEIKNLKDAAGSLIGDESIFFTTSIDSATPSILAQPSPILPEGVLIVDKSVRTDIETSYQIIAKNPDFFIQKTHPENGDFFIQRSENNGRVVIVFNQRPAGNFLSNRYFKGQRKKIQTLPSRWEDVPVRVSLHSWKPEVYVDFPSLESSGYFVENEDYFESGYKYRIVISERIGI
jgi:hypothetical protein